MLWKLLKTRYLRGFSIKPKIREKSAKMSNEIQYQANTSKHSERVIQKYKNIALSTPNLKKDEEYALIKQYKSNPPGSKEHEEAKEKIINSFLRTVLYLSERFCHRNHLDPLDIIQCGIMGILNALQRFNLEEYKVVTKSTGSLFACYTYRGILLELSIFYRKNIRGMAVSDGVNHQLNEINKLYKSGMLSEFLEAGANGHFPLVRFICEKLGMKEKQVKQLLTLFKPEVYLDKKIEESSDGGEVGAEEYKDRLLKTHELDNPRSIYQNSDSHDFLLKKIDELEPEDRYIISTKYGLRGGEPATCQEIAQKLKRSITYVTTKAKKIQDKLKVSIEREFSSI